MLKGFVCVLCDVPVVSQHLRKDIYKTKYNLQCLDMAGPLFKAPLVSDNFCSSSHYDSVDPSSPFWGP